jgi:ribosomal protein S18 acetylase RimI-like enzyme
LRLSTPIRPESSARDRRKIAPSLRRASVQAPACTGMLGCAPHVSVHHAMDLHVVPTEERHLPEVYRVIDAVASEGKYLAFVRAPAWESSLAFYRSLLAQDCPYVVAVAESRVVGWCDVAPQMGESRSHIGTLGIGLLPEWRGQGLGRRLMEAAVAKSWMRGFTRIELSVRDDNVRAKALYEKLGFEVEGLRRRASVVKEEVHDVWAMALLK